MNTIQLIKKSIDDHYTDSYGYADHCVRDPKLNGEPASGNGKLYHSQACIMMNRLGVERNIRLEHLFYVAWHRHPLLNANDEKHDNIVGLTCASYVIGLPEKNRLIHYMTTDFPLYQLPNGVYLAPHVAFIINFCNCRSWGIINTVWFASMILTTPYKMHKDGAPNCGERLLGWTYLQPIVKRFPKLGGWLERWYWKKADIDMCANRYYGLTPWTELFYLLRQEIFGEYK